MPGLIHSVRTVELTGMDKDHQDQHTPPTSEPTQGFIQEESDER